MACCMNYVAVLHDEEGNVLQEVMVPRPSPTLVLPAYLPSRFAGPYQSPVARIEPDLLRYDTFKRGHSQTRQQGVIETHYYRQLDDR